MNTQNISQPRNAVNAILAMDAEGKWPDALLAIFERDQLAVQLAQAHQQIELLQKKIAELRAIVRAAHEYYNTSAIDSRAEAQAAYLQAMGSLQNEIFS